MKLIEECLVFNKEYYIAENGLVYEKGNEIISPVTFSYKNQKAVLIILFNDNINTAKMWVHELVAKYYLTNPFNYKYILHKDNNKLNNRIDNLYWNITAYKKGTDLTTKENLSPRTIKYSKNKKIIINLQDEEWKQHPHLNIQVSTMGRVKRNNLLYKIIGEQNNYKSVTANNKIRRIHRLVAETFLGKPTITQTQVNHIDGNRSNNRPVNLEWVTPKENSENKKKRQAFNKPNDLMRNLKSFNHLQLTNEEFLNQKWKVIPVLDFSFYASDKGMIKRIIFNEDNSIKNEYIKLAELTPNGYYECRLSNGNRKINNFKAVRKGIHTLVALAWIENLENKYTVNHKDKNKFNNRLENLEWATIQEQQIHKNSL